MQGFNDDDDGHDAVKVSEPVRRTKILAKRETMVCVICILAQLQRALLRYWGD